jgi:hypothetical protein
MEANAGDPVSVETNKVLEERAAKLKAFLETRPAKRPLILEFSGSPKAGKTRCISVLELFLKRNGIRTEVYTERASVSPIKSKGHLNFNVWVSCASLQGMLEALYKDIDVFILDRAFLMRSFGTNGSKRPARSHTTKANRLSSSLQWHVGRIWSMWFSC